MEKSLQALLFLVFEIGLSAHVVRNRVISSTLICLSE